MALLTIRVLMVVTLITLAQACTQERDWQPTGRTKHCKGFPALIEELDTTYVPVYRWVTEDRSAIISNIDHIPCFTAEEL